MVSLCTFAEMKDGDGVYWVPALLVPNTLENNGHGRLYV